MGRTNRCSLVSRAAVALGLLLLLAAPAQAHGLGSSDANRPVPEYLWIGFKHPLAGWDHLLFILAADGPSGLDPQQVISDDHRTAVRPSTSTTQLEDARRRPANGLPLPSTRAATA